MDLARLKELASSKEIRLYAVLDACGQPLVPEFVKELVPHAISLYRGKAENEHMKIAPYLVAVDDHVLTWIHDNVWSEPWGFFATSLSELFQLRTHFRRFLMVDGPEGKELYFRFYDPRVLHPFLLSASSVQIARFFGPIHSLGIVNQDLEVIEFTPSSEKSSSNSKPSKLAFSHESMDAFADARRTIFSQRLHRQLCVELTELGRKFQSHRLSEEIDKGIQRALLYEMNAQRDIARYVDAICVLGNGFTGEQDAVPIQDILFDRRVTWSERLDQLEAYLKSNSAHRTAEIN